MGVQWPISLSRVLGQQRRLGGSCKGPEWLGRLLLPHQDFFGPLHDGGTLGRLDGDALSSAFLFSEFGSGCIGDPLDPASCLVPINLGFDKGDLFGFSQVIIQWTVSDPR
jgi:hypothetical protein